MGSGNIVWLFLESTLMPNIPNQPNIKLVSDPNYRENYANSVQVRVNVWDFFLVFGTMQQHVETEVEIRNFQGVYLSPQQAKALMAILQQNVANYEQTFGEIKLDPRMAQGGGPIN
jgi:hypothetical protein